MAPTLVAATSRLPPAQLDLAAEACRETGVRLLTWAGGALPPGDDRPLAMIAALEPGERRIPPDLHHVMTKELPGLALLLLCSEPLVDGTLKVARGRVTLLGPPHSPASIAAELRGLVSPAPPPAAARPLRATPPPATPPSPAAPRRAAPLVRSRELLRRTSWTARIQCHEAGTPEPRLPALHQRSGDGVTLFVFAVDRPAPPDGALVEIAEQLARAARGPAVEQAAARLGDHVGLVRLSAEANLWQVHWPFEGPLWLVSPRRAPAWWDAGAALAPGRPWQWIEAHGDDLVLAFNRPLPGSLREREELSAALAAGGPETLELLEQRLRGRPFAVSGILVAARGAA